MAQTPVKVAELVLEEGPFPRTLVKRWPEDLQKDYVELLAQDLKSLGLEEFRRMRRALGEAYLLSLDQAIDSNPDLLEAWTALTGNASAPEMPEFRTF